MLDRLAIRPRRPRNPKTGSCRCAPRAFCACKAALHAKTLLQGMPRRYRQASDSPSPTAGRGRRMLNTKVLADLSGALTRSYEQSIYPELARAPQIRIRGEEINVGKV